MHWYTNRMVAGVSQGHWVSSPPTVPHDLHTNAVKKFDILVPILRYGWTSGNQLTFTINGLNCTLLTWDFSLLVQCNVQL